MIPYTAPGLSTSVDVAAERRMLKAAFRARMKTISRSIQDRDFVILVPEEVANSKNRLGYRAWIQKLKRVRATLPLCDFDTDRETGLVVSAYMVGELLECELLMVKRVNGTAYIMHKYHPQFGFNNPSVNYGLPPGIKVRNLKPGDVLKVTFLDEDEPSHAILLERDNIDKTRKSGYEYSARVLYQQSGGTWTMAYVSFHQIHSVRHGALNLS